MNLSLVESLKQPGIYCIKNTVNSKIYIGSAVDLCKRLHHHKTRLRTGKHINRHLQSAWNKYGAEAFSCQIIELIHDKKNLLKAEQHYLNTLLFAKEFISRENNKFQELGYNSYPTAQSPAGRIVSAETKDKIRKTNTGKKQSPETIAKRVKTITGMKKRPHSEATKRRLSEFFMGKPAWNKGLKGIYSDEQKKRISNSLKKLYANGYVNSQKNKPLSRETKIKVSESLKRGYANGSIVHWTHRKSVDKTALENGKDPSSLEGGGAAPVAEPAAPVGEEK